MGLAPYDWQMGAGEANFKPLRPLEKRREQGRRSQVEQTGTAPHPPLPCAQGEGEPRRSLLNPEVEDRPAQYFFNSPL
jgi:hypothetical protein